MLQEGDKKKGIDTMKEIISYEAFDGTIFEDEDECVAYEKQAQSGEFLGQIHFFNASKKPLKLSCDQDYIYYAVVKTLDAAVWWNDRCAEEGLEQPFKTRAYAPGFYWYDTYTDKWKSLEEEKEKLQLMADEFQYFIEEK